MGRTVAMFRNAMGGYFISLLKYVYIRNGPLWDTSMPYVINGKNIHKSMRLFAYESGNRDLQQAKFIYKLSFVHLHNENA